MKDDQQAIETVAALKWYFEAKNLALHNVMKLRRPLAVHQQKEMRLYYSEYFAHLVSATELLLEKEHPYSNQFKDDLEKALVFEGHLDGESNYSFIRELRNSVIHRGYDIAASAHVAGDFLMVVAPTHLTNRAGTMTYQGLGDYLLEVIWKCEAVIGPAIARHLAAVGLLEPKLSQDEAVAAGKISIAESNAMPQWAKQMATNIIGAVDHIDIQRTQISGLVMLLNTNALEVASGQPGAQADRPAFSGSAAQLSANPVRTASADRHS